MSRTSKRAPAEEYGWLTAQMLPLLIFVKTKYPEIHAEWCALNDKVQLVTTTRVRYTPWLKQHHPEIYVEWRLTNGSK